jgi:hypothetical protein
MLEYEIERFDTIASDHLRIGYADRLHDLLEPLRVRFVDGFRYRRVAPYLLIGISTGTSFASFLITLTHRKEFFAETVVRRLRKRSAREAEKSE